MWKYAVNLRTFLIFIWKYAFASQWIVFGVAVRRTDVTSTHKRTQCVPIYSGNISRCSFHHIVKLKFLISNANRRECKTMLPSWNEAFAHSVYAAYGSDCGATWATAKKEWKHIFFVTLRLSWPHAYSFDCVRIVIVRCTITFSDSNEY